MLRIRFHGRGGVSRWLCRAGCAGVRCRTPRGARGGFHPHRPCAYFGAWGYHAGRSGSVVADDTFLTELAAQPLAGCNSHCTVLLNSTEMRQLCGTSRTTMDAFWWRILQRLLSS